MDILELTKKIREAKNEQVVESLTAQLGTLLDIRLKGVNKIIPTSVILNTVERNLEDYITRYADVDVTPLRNAKDMYSLLTAYLRVVNEVVERLVDPEYESRFGYVVSKNRSTLKIDMVVNAVDIVTTILGIGEKVSVNVNASPQNIPVGGSSWVLSSTSEETTKTNQ